MRLVDSLFSLTASESSPSAPEPRVWDCSSPSQVFNAAFEVHDAAMRAGFMPDEATTLSLSLAELGTQAVVHGNGGKATVQFKDEGWELEVEDSGPAAGRVTRPILRSPLPHPLTTLEIRSERGNAVVVAHYARGDQA